MRIVRASTTAIAAVALTATAAVSTAAATPVTGCKPGAGTHIVVTSSYRFALRVGMPEKMYTPAQARKMHPKSGEIMLRGKMSGGMGMGGMPMGGAMRHLEVQICSKKTRSVITDAHPTIVVTDDTAKGMPMNVPIAVMEGVGEGIADLHYGNNVRMPAGHRFTVTVKLKGQRAVFHVRSPKTMSM